MPEFVTRAELRSFAAKKTLTEQAAVRKTASTPAGRIDVPVTFEQG
ncbi:hypothetical protein [Allomesorhizobium camelthorni]|nr:hypothetical protein [Mesorhizobium camelthorni]